MRSVVLVAALFAPAGCSRQPDHPAEPPRDEWMCLMIPPPAPGPVVPAQPLAPAVPVNVINVICDNRRVCPDVVHE